MTKWSFSLLLLPLALWGCGNSVCEDAQDHINECLEGAAPATADEPDCDDKNECKAECAVAAPCEAFTDGTSQANQNYQDCVNGCG